MTRSANGPYALPVPNGPAAPEPEGASTMDGPNSSPDSDQQLSQPDRSLLALVQGYAAANDIECEQPDERSLAVVLPGKHKLKTTVLLVIGHQSVTVNAFVIRQPDENHAAFYRWLLERNRRTYGVAFALDRLGDVYLVGHVAKAGLDEAELDRLLGSVLETADGAFDSLLELGFSSAIRREWRWRLSRGESTRNLEAFRHLVDPPDRRQGAQAPVVRQDDDS